MDINKLASNLKMNNLYFKECFIQREDVIVSKKMKVDVSKSITNLANHQYSVEVTVNISSDEINCRVIAVADFLFDGDEEIEESIINANTVAIMFPFIRSQVSLITTQPNMSPVILPPINTKKLVD